MVFAGALAGEALYYDASLDWLIRAAWRDTIHALPWATGGTILWVLIAYRYHQSLINSVTGAREVTRKEEPRLYNLLENLCISRGIPMPKLKVDRRGGAQRLRQRPQPEAIFDHRDHGPAGSAGRCRESRPCSAMS